MRCYALASALLSLIALGNPSLGQGTPAAARFDIQAPQLALTGIPFDLEIIALDEWGSPIRDYSGPFTVEGLAAGPTEVDELVDGRAILEDVVIDRAGRSDIVVRDRGAETRQSIRAIPGYLSVLPPLLAIALALAFRQVVLSLFVGIWLGATLLFDYDAFGGFFRVLDYFIVRSLSDTSHVQIVLFSLLFGGMVGVITHNGGARGIANLITRYARTPRGGQLAAWGLAFFLFFDDYANVLVRGNLMRPITDRLKISREKLAFHVDTGAATVASLFIISTWIGYEVGLIQQGLQIIDSPANAYTMFIRTIPYRFYPIFALILAFLVAVTGRDLGPMLTAGRRARRENKVLRDGAVPATDLAHGGPTISEDVPSRWINGLAPVATILLVGLFGLYLTGSRALAEEGISSYGIADVVSKADSYVALLWASLSGCVVAILLSVVQRILTAAQAIEAWVHGLKAMILAMLILVLAWSLGSVTEELKTADFLVQILRDVLSPYWLPALTFVISAAVAFATGTSWATMAIILPLVIPLTHTLGIDMHLGAEIIDHLLLGVVSSVLAGAVFGDHCSPISDTTILSSMSSACDHIDHVRTQLPYALIAAGVGIVVGDIPTAYGLPAWVSILVGTLVLLGILLVFGDRDSD